ncbi:hypothetical protein [Stenotrophomonas sp.]|uniref:hypothetical protein n=1 Tax=Stenotrophomonas sp. TaxID=69392 RepID=UPI0028AC1063|nr:hypothetical protein [Stenotrophomonas sp.]
MSKFDYGDRAKVADFAEIDLRPGAIVWVVGVFADRPSGGYFEKFPTGVVYSVEYEDGTSTEIHEDLLMRLEDT